VTIAALIQLETFIDENNLVGEKLGGDGIKGPQQMYQS
jgi:hypothetical protein